MWKLILTMALICTSAEARENEKWAQSDPGIRGWYKDQHVPNGSPQGGMSCCSDADAVTAEEDIRKGDYWAAFHITIKDTNKNVLDDVDVPFMKVPETAILKGPFPSRVGQPIVWWWVEWDDSRSGIVKRLPSGIPAVFIRCYKPGSGF